MRPKLHSPDKQYRPLVLNVIEIHSLCAKNVLEAAISSAKQWLYYEPRQNVFLVTALADAEYEIHEYSINEVLSTTRKLRLFSPFFITFINFFGCQG
jgi:hypothetical protein